MPNDALVIEPDVLIIGGGVQGLWLLNELHEKQYSAVLLERGELGGAQTCHSHVYIHQGYLYREASLAARLKGVQKPWDDWVHKHRPGRGFQPSFFGFRNPGDGEEHFALWKAAGLDRREASLPTCLVGGEIRVVYESPEMCLEGHSLVEGLQSGVAEFISAVREVDRFHTKIAAGTGVKTVEQIDVQTARGCKLRILPRAVVLAAGAGNSRLLDLLSGGDRRLMGLLQHAQQIRKAHMLVVSGDKQRFDPLTGVFLLPAREFRKFTFFIVSRIDAGEVGDETVWLVSDNRSEALSYVEDVLEYGPGSWLPLVLRSLQKLAPKYFRDPKRMQFKWGVYEAPKAEGRAGGEIPQEERIERFGFKNLWVLWPTKLTLAPKVSSVVMNGINKLIPKPGPWGTSMLAAWRDCRQAPLVAPERWVKTPKLDWEEFCRSYL